MNLLAHIKNALALLAKMVVQVCVTASQGRFVITTKIYVDGRRSLITIEDFFMNAQNVTSYIVYLGIISKLNDAKKRRNYFVSLSTPYTPYKRLKKYTFGIIFYLV